MRRSAKPGARPVIEARRAQRSFAEGLIAEEVSDLWEDWMRAADQLLDDEQLLTTVYEALAKRRPNSRTAAGWALLPKWFCACSC